MPEGRGLKRFAVDPPLCSRRACLHTAFHDLSANHVCARYVFGSLPVFVLLTSLAGVTG